MQTLAMQGPLRADAVTRDAVRARQRTGRIPGGRPCRHLAAPLAKVASGGELSRISLALSVIASRAARVPTLIFDEVDSGVGGAVAEVVGKLLRELGERHQVLCVTHLPQVAACANSQFLVSKAESRGTTRSSIEALDDAARVEEIARMLGGISSPPPPANTRAKCWKARSRPRADPEDRSPGAPVARRPALMIKSPFQERGF